MPLASRDWWSLATLLPTRRRLRGAQSVFVSTTGEEAGQLGAQYYCKHPLYPLNKTLADINLDGMNVFGRTKDVTVIGPGLSSLDDVLQAVAADQERVAYPDSQPESGMYYRVDSFSFARQGVPSMNLCGGGYYPGKPEGWGSQMWGKYIRDDYHRPSDTIKPYWDLSGMVDDLHLLGEVGYRVANSKTFPEWVAGGIFSSPKGKRCLKQ